jgi:ribulose-5-phosphate 4-epimerase/fuculose-1-phosphate aldolase
VRDHFYSCWLILLKLGAVNKQKVEQLNVVAICMFISHVEEKNSRIFLLHLQLYRARNCFRFSFVLLVHTDSDTDFSCH